jgi:hypothetical protein
MPYSYCPRCGGPLHRAGEIVVRNYTGRRVRVPVYYCSRCGLRTTGV